ncbi:hypothetical protein PtrSN002B_007952 [Pyrenophora tritici-repentis]|uniref:Uncharacterized protein n=1 Tax=Pyrenophora tritici-repentis TaxID=45151 RepID=A0A5M9LIL6_9PLEO|nr:hypothetical protein PtrV1_06338 [Pyrenophora tritici-repentis]KAF7573738.1 hypothetical protein PtrM4_086430 [Pyrenophora tritici-repentis]KAI1533081.1 hypothetical protein PtrSN001C_007720 [Pyrenophora tritici-repentis]KAI1543085.1 hypothetical protein PtrSN002B_007952 [Pyrenophora tritici-repentis]KAI1565668.1 hypothetical protein PtrEW4_008093 [Pyrenophora tritici-repentis]
MSITRDVPPNASFYDNPILSDIKIRQISSNGETKEYFGQSGPMQSLRVVLQGIDRFIQDELLNIFTATLECSTNVLNLGGLPGYY